MKKYQVTVAGGEIVEVDADKIASRLDGEAGALHFFRGNELVALFALGHWSYVEFVDPQPKSE